MHKWYVSLLDAVRVFADVAIIKIPNIEKITNKIISNYTNIVYLDKQFKPPRSNSLLYRGGWTRIQTVGLFGSL